MNLINKDQRQRQDQLDKEYLKDIKREQQLLILLGCAAGMLTIVMMALLGLV